VQDSHGREVPSQVTLATQWCLNIRPNQGFTANEHYEVVLDRFMIRNARGDVASVMNGEEALGRYRVCVQGGEDMSRRPQADNGCENERSTRAARPQFLTATRAIEARRAGQTNPDTVPVTDFVEHGFDPNSATPAASAHRSSRPPMETLTFKDAAGHELGRGTIDCNGLICMAATGQPDTCFRSVPAVLNRLMYLRSAGCRP
jgi:hypothetical protein